MSLAQLRRPAPALLVLCVAAPAPGLAGPHDHGDDDPFPDHADTITIEVEGAPADLRGAGDVRIDVREAQAVHRADVEDALQLAPGLLMTRPGGEGAPMQVFLRGFDARHGQDVAFTIDGLPMNQIGNPHGHGLVDLRIAPAEVLSALEVRPGVSDPSQGDFAVAGSIALELGMPEPGLLLGLSGGSFGTARGVIGWRHPDRAGTFLVGELYRTAGFGASRAGQRGSVLARVQGDRGRVTVGVAASDFQHAGLVRRIDVDEGRVDLYGTSDPRQGSGGAVAWATGAWRERVDATDVELVASASRRSSFIRYNYTGFLTDDRRPGESPHAQRGDLLDQRANSTTLHAEARISREIALSSADARIEAGVRGRYDDVDAGSQRLRAIDGAPYRAELDVGLRQADLGLWAGGEFEKGPLILRLGGRAQAFGYQLHDRCAARDTWFPGAITDDVNCPAVDRDGPRLRDAHRSASGLGLAPRGSAALDVAPGHRLLAGGGRGFRSIEAMSLSEGERAPFAELWGGDVGWSWIRSGERTLLSHQLVAFATTVSRELVFDEDLGTNIVGGPSTRLGATIVSEVHHGPLRAHTSVTATYAVFGDELPPSVSRTRYDRQAGQLVPYVPPLIARTDITWTWRAGPVGLRHGVGVLAIGPRPLPLSAWAEPFATVDVGTEARLGALELGVAVTNALGARYALTEYNYASWFPETSGTPFPSRLPARQISPGAPRAVMFTVAVHPDSRPRRPSSIPPEGA